MGKAKPSWVRSGPQGTLTYRVDSQLIIMWKRKPTRWERLCWTWAVVRWVLFGWGP